MKKLNKEQLITAKGAIISSTITEHYLRESKNLGLFVRSAKGNVSKTLNDLKDIEDNWFTPVYNTDKFKGDLGGEQVNNIMCFINRMVKGVNFDDFEKLCEIYESFKLDPNRISRISDKIHLENNAIKI